MTAMASKISFSKTKKKNKKKKKKRRNKHNQGKNVIYMLIILHNELVI
jgi:cytochrome b561